MARMLGLVRGDVGHPRRVVTTRAGPDRSLLSRRTDCGYVSPAIDGVDRPLRKARK